MEITQEMVPDILEKIADGVDNPQSVAHGTAYQLARIADALERIAAALDAQKWGTEDSREPFNIHSLLLLISQKL